MTKDEEKMLFCLYGIFKEKNKTESKGSAKYITNSEITEKCNAVFHSEDIDDILSDLESGGYISEDSLGGVTLEKKSLEFVENRPKEKLKDVADFLSKFF